MKGQCEAYIHNIGVPFARHVRVVQELLGGRARGTSEVDLFLPEVDKENYLGSIFWEKASTSTRLQNAH